MRAQLCHGVRVLGASHDGNVLDILNDGLKLTRQVGVEQLYEVLGFHGRGRTLLGAFDTCTVAPRPPSSVRARGVRRLRRRYSPVDRADQGESVRAQDGSGSWFPLRGGTGRLREITG